MKNNPSIRQRSLPANIRLAGSAAYSVLAVACLGILPANAQSLELKVQQITFGSKHHFFGYIGQCQTVPWNAGDRYILGMEIENIDRMPRPEEAAVIIRIDPAPRWNRASNAILVPGIAENKTRQMFVIQVVTP